MNPLDFGGDLVIPPHYRFGKPHPGRLARLACRLLGHVAPGVAAARWACRRCGAGLPLAEG
jgi:hypothetical protein